MLFQQTSRLSEDEETEAGSWVAYLRLLGSRGWSWDEAWQPSGPSKHLGSGVNREDAHLSPPPAKLHPSLCQPVPFPSPVGVPGNEEMEIDSSGAKTEHSEPLWAPGQTVTSPWASVPHLQNEQGQSTPEAFSAPNCTHLNTAT